VDEGFDYIAQRFHAQHGRLSECAAAVWPYSIELAGAAARSEFCSPRVSERGFPPDRCRPI